MLDQNKKIILASASPRRKEILEKAGYSIEVKVPMGEELDIVGKTYSEKLVNDCAENKAKNAKEEFAEDNDSLLIVTCDTVVVNDSVIIGKPKNREDAYNILKSLSNKMHKVASSICIVNNGKYLLGHEVTNVWFREISDKDIYDYIDRCKPFDKAGSYGIQDENFDFAIKVEGNIDNVIGFPLTTFNNLYKKII